MGIKQLYNDNLRNYQMNTETIFAAARKNIFEKWSPCNFKQIDFVKKIKHDLKSRLNLSNYHKIVN